MTPAPRLGSYRRLFVSVALISFTAGVMAASFPLADEKVAGTRAATIFITSVDLQVETASSTGGFLSNPNFAPGDVTRGSVTLYTQSPDPHELYDLDLDVTHQLSGHREGALRLQDVLFVTVLRYGSDDLLSTADGGRDLLREIDGNLLLGDRDGRLSMTELEAGINDLPPPAPRPTGTPLTVEVTIGGPGIPRERYHTLSGQTLRITFQWYLAGTQESDLNADHGPCPAALALDTGYTIPVNPLVNPDFDVGFADPVTTRDPLGNGLLQDVGDTAPILTDDRGEVVAPGWSLRPYTDDGTPLQSTHRWGPHAGLASRTDPMTRDGAVVVKYRDADRGPGWPILVQDLGQRATAGALSTPREVGVWLSTLTPGKPVQVIAGVYLKGDPTPLYATRVWEPHGTTRFEYVAFPFPAVEGTVTQVFFAFKGADAGGSEGAEIVLDEVTYGAATLRPAADGCLYPSGFPHLLLAHALP